MQVTLFYYKKIKSVMQSVGRIGKLMMGEKKILKKNEKYFKKKNN